MTAEQAREYRDILDLIDAEHPSVSDILTLKSVLGRLIYQLYLETPEEQE